MDDSHDISTEEPPAETPLETQIQPQEVDWKQKAFRDFSRWLQEIPDQMPGPDEPAMESCDLYTLLTEFVALRQEIKFQNREQHSAVRIQQGLIDSHKEIMGLFKDRTRQLEKLEENIRRASERKIITPFLDIRDALNRGLRFARQIALKRGLFRRPQRTVHSVVEGYEMALRRFDRALLHAGIRPVDAIGKPFDPLTMEAVEERFERGTPAGQVLDMYLCGFVCDNEVIRTAQVAVSTAKTS